MLITFAQLYGAVWTIAITLKKADNLLRAAEFSIADAKLPNELRGSGNSNCRCYSSRFSEETPPPWTVLEWPTMRSFAEIEETLLFRPCRVAPRQMIGDSPVEFPSLVRFLDVRYDHLPSDALGQLLGGDDSHKDGSRQTR